VTEFDQPVYLYYPKIEGFKSPSIVVLAVQVLTRTQWCWC